MKPKFSIGIPTLNRADLLIPALMYYKLDFPDIRVSVLDNGNQNLQEFFYKITTGFILSSGTNYPLIYNYKPQKNRGVAASWNFLIKNIFMDNTIEYAAILNDDILWGQDQETMNIFLSGVKREHDFRIEGNNDKGFILTADQSIYSWSIFIINRKAWQTIGEFDENFYPAYFEDCDYKYRAKLAGVPIYPCLKGPCRFVTSGTAAKDRSILDFSIKNRDYFIEKWGGEPGNEVFTTPFGGKNKVGE